MAMTSSAVLLAAFIAVLCMVVPSQAWHHYYVGGDKGWVANPAESYNDWAAKIHFHVYDYLVFKFDNCTESVLEVSQSAYDACNITDPFRNMTSGLSWFNLEFARSYYFIDGDHDRCEHGQKMTVTVDAKSGGGPVAPVPPSPIAPGTSPVPPAPGSQTGTSEGPAAVEQPPSSAAVAVHGSSFAAIVLPVGFAIAMAALLG